MELVREALRVRAIRSSKNRVTYVLTCDTLHKLNAKRWSRQRPADETRVAEILSWITRESYVQGVLSMAWHPTEGLIVYDGQHRWRALLQVTVPVEVLVEILWDTDEQEIIRSFQAVNRSVPVPELYVDAPLAADTLRGDVEAYIKTLVSRYPSHVSVSARPNRPNFNRDKLSDTLYDLWKECGSPPFKTIVDALETVNQEYDTDPFSVPRISLCKSPAILKKCMETHFWLTAVSLDVLAEHVKGLVTL